jgi:benzoate membrane transport protein
MPWPCGSPIYLSALYTLGIPLLVLTFGVGNLQALAVLKSEGYRARGKLFGIVAGVATVVNALGGGHAAAVGGAAMTLTARPAAGPSDSRFWAIVISSLPVVVIALAAVPVITIVQGLPVSYTLSIGAFALIAPLIHVFGKTVSGPLRLGGITAFVIAALPFQVAGMPMAFWAIVAGVAVSAILESRSLVQAWRTGREVTT